MIRIALRLHLAGIIGYTLFFASFALVEVTSYGQLTGSAGTGVDRLSFAAEMQVIGRQTSYLVDPPWHLEVLAGYLQWFLVGFFGTFYGVWALLAGTAAVRSDEEKGLVEQWLAAGVTPARMLFSRLLAFGVAAGASMLAVALFAVLVARAGGQDLPLAGTAEQVLVQLGPPLFVFGFGLALAQFLVSRRNALGIGGLVLGGLVLLNGFSRSVDYLRPYRWVSPFAYTDRSHAMTAGGGVDLAAAAVPYLAALALTGLAVYLASRRDLGAALVRIEPSDGPPVREASGNPLLRIPGLNVVWEQRLGLATWGFGVALYAVSNLPLAKPFVSFFTKASGTTLLQAQASFGVGARNPVLGFISKEWFTVATLLLCAYAITQVARWAADDVEGRLEMVLSTGLPRWRVILERGLGLLAGGPTIAAANVVGVQVGAAAAGIQLDLGRLVAASALMLPVALAFGAVGATIASWRPRVAMASLIGVLAASYFIPFMGVPIFHKLPPEWFLDLSVFQLYGSPLVDGPFWRGELILLAVALAGFAAALAAMQRREVGR